MARKIPKKRAVAPMSFSKTITSIAMPHIATIGTRYGTGGTGNGPMRRGECASTSRYSSRYAAKKTTRSSFTASHGSMDPGPTLIQIRAPLISRPMTGKSGATRSKTPRNAHVHLNRASAVRSRGMRIVAAKAPPAVPGSLFEPQRNAPDAKLVAVLEALARADGLTVHERAVRAPGVLDPPLAIRELDECVAGRRGLVVDDEVVPCVPADRVHRAERKAIPHARGATDAALHHEERDSGGARRDPRLRAERALERAERADQEEVEDDQKGDAHAPEQYPERDLHLFSCAVQKLDSTDRQTVAVGEHDLGDAPAVHVGAVGALQVVEREAAEPQADLGVFARHAPIVEDNVVLRIAPDRKRVGAEADLATVLAFANGEGGLRCARPLPEELLAIEHHRVTGFDRTERLGVRSDLLT